MAKVKKAAVRAASVPEVYAVNSAPAGAPVAVAERPEVKPDFDPTAMREKPEPTVEERERSLPDIIAESRKIIGIPVQPGMKLFEAPNGYVQLGEKDADRVWCRYAEAEPGKDVHGAWINPMRGVR